MGGGWDHAHRVVSTKSRGQLHLGSCDTEEPGDEEDSIRGKSGRTTYYQDQLVLLSISN